MFQLFNKNSTYLNSKGATGTPCEHFQVVAAKKLQPLPHRVNRPLPALHDKILDASLNIFSHEILPQVVLEFQRRMRM